MNRPTIAEAEARFRATLTREGAELLEPHWLGTRRPHRARCAAGHVCSPTPANVYRGQGICRTCAGRDPAAAEARFRARVAELGGEVLAYFGTQPPASVRCAAGHVCSPRPANVMQGGGICRTCVGRDPAAAEARFRARVAELGGEVIGRYIDTATPVLVRCANGHEATRRPNNVSEGRIGICGICAGHPDSAAAWAAFRARVAELGGEVLEPRWLGALKPHRVRCGAGHETTVCPHSIQGGRSGCCKVCSGKDSAAAEARFRARVAELGGEVLEPRWLGVETPHRVRCAAGHLNSPKPGNVHNGQGICRVCSGYDSAAAEAAFRARVAELGGEVLEPRWLGASTPHRVRCAAGHEAAPWPTFVQQGGGICRFCAGSIWDVFYVVADQAAGRIKFGITSGDPRARLRDHQRAGYRERVLVLEGLPGMVAPEIEAAAIAALALAGVKPIRGREYYEAEAALAVVLDIADHYPR